MQHTELLSSTNRSFALNPKVDRSLIRDYIRLMGDLDSELRKAVLESERDADPGRAGAPGETSGIELPEGDSEGPRPARNLGLLIALLAAGAAILTLVFTSVDEAAIYSVSTDQLVSQRDKYQDRNVRVEGDLVSGSLKHRKEPCEYRFSIEKNGKELDVRYPECVVPDTFKDVPGIEVQVTAEGKLNAEGHFDATHIMAKCPSKYEMQQRAEKGEAAPHATMGTLPNAGPAAPNAGPATPNAGPAAPNAGPAAPRAGQAAPGAGQAAPSAGQPAGKPEAGY